jgi:RNA polymerase sigma-70 factor (ECF subfamily)
MKASDAVVIPFDPERRGASEHPPEDWAYRMAAAQRGDAEAYRALLTDVTRWLSAWFRRRLPPDRVEDAVQETLVAVHAKRHTYEPSRPFLPWLAAIARYKWIDQLRAMRRESAAPLPENLALEIDETAILSAGVLTRLLARLKPAQAEVIRLVRIEGLSIEEAARATGQSPSLVKVNIHRGLGKLIAWADAERE